MSYARLGSSFDKLGDGGLKGLFAFVLPCFLALATGGSAQGTGAAIVIDIKGPIGPATGHFVTRGLKRAAERNARIVVLRIDTPGGLDSAMREIVKAVLASPVPVAGYVAPGGARAASAGAYILYATHIAAMAPGTDLGAATPVRIGAPGQPPQRPSPIRRGKDEKKDADKTEDGAEDRQDRPAGGHPTARDKAVNEAAAYIRGLAEMRGRNADWAEKAVREAASLTAKDALEENVVDLIAEDIGALLTAINGRTTPVAGKDRTLETAGLTPETLEPDWRSELLGIVANPNVAYILMMIGIYGIVFEFYSPGAILPGTVGAISLLLALYAFDALPVNHAGLALILLGAALMASEAFVPSFGALGIGGIVAFVVGSIMLMDTDAPGFRIHTPLVGGVATVGAGLFFFLIAMMMRARKRAAVSGPEEMIGIGGEVLSWSGSEGRVRAHGEVWLARGDADLAPGSRIRVNRLDGLVLIVEPDS